MVILVSTSGVLFLDNRTYSSQNCPCTVGEVLAPPHFINANYYCESGSVDTYNQSAYYLNGPLWDGSDCYTSIRCCSSLIHSPWLYRSLDETTTSDLEARICSWVNFGRGTPLVDQLHGALHSVNYYIHKLRSANSSVFVHIMHLYVFILANKTL